MLKRLRRKFVVINMLVVVTILLLSISAIYHSTRKNIVTQSIQKMQMIAADPWDDSVRDCQKGMNLPYLVLLRKDDGSLERVQGYFEVTDREDLNSLVEAVLAEGHQAGVLEDRNLRYCLNDGDRGTVIVLADMSGEKNLLSSLNRTCGLIGIICFLVFHFACLILARWAVKPVEEAWDQQKQFVADASHELKTPLTVILTNSEILLSKDCTSETHARSAEIIHTMTLQMRGLVDGLLELARVDGGAVPASMTRLNLSELVSDCLLPFEALYFERDLMLESSIEENIMVKGSDMHLRQTMDVLLDNALKYSTSPGTVSLKLKRQGRRCIISLASPGAEISREDLKNIFKRFYRVDKVRQMDHSYGLGLSIASAAVKAHRGRIWAESGNGVNTFFVELPVTA